MITGRTAKPNQVIELVNSGDKTASLPNRRFSFSLTYLPDTCKISLKVENDEIKDLLVSSCMPRGGAGDSGKDGKDGKDGRRRQGRTRRQGWQRGHRLRRACRATARPSAAGPATCIGLWFIKDYPAPNSRTVAHIAPDRAAGGNRLNLTEPQDPLKTEKIDGPGVTQSAEIDKDKLFLVNRQTKARTGVRGEVAADCKSIVWKGEGDGTVRTWER